MTVARDQNINLNYIHKQFEYVVIHEGLHDWTLKKIPTFSTVHLTAQCLNTGTFMSVSARMCMRLKM